MWYNIRAKILELMYHLTRLFLIAGFFYLGADMKHRYYRKCEYCGAILDPGETCDCQKKAAADQNADVDPDRHDIDLACLDDLKNLETEKFFDLFCS